MVALLLWTGFYSSTAGIASDITSGQPTRVLLTVGGVSYSPQILTMFQSMPQIDTVVKNTDDTAIVFSKTVLQDVDVIVMYHRDNVAEPEEQQALLEFLDGGGGIIVLHHAIANYASWVHWWQNLVGGLYVLPGHEGLPASRYFFGFEGVARPVADHPITNRLEGRWLYADESYDRLWISNDVKALLSTTAFGSSEHLAWIGPSNIRKVVFIQPGHSERIMFDKKYRYLLEDAIGWAASN